MPKPKIKPAENTAPVTSAVVVAVAPPAPVVLPPTQSTPVVDELANTPVSEPPKLRNRVNIQESGFVLFLGTGKTVEHVCNTTEEVEKFIRDLHPTQQNRVTVYKRVPCAVTTTIAFGS